MKKLIIALAHYNKGQYIYILQIQHTSEEYKYYPPNLPWQLGVMPMKRK